MSVHGAAICADEDGAYLSRARRSSVVVFMACADGERPNEGGHREQRKVISKDVLVRSAASMPWAAHGVFLSMGGHARPREISDASHFSDENEEFLAGQQPRQLRRDSWLLAHAHN
jgi:hypothetical protein